MFWEPHGRQLAFFADGTLKRIDMQGGAPVTICNVREGLGLTGTWSADGTILFASVEGEAIFSVPAAGGSPVELMRPDPARKEIRITFPTASSGRQGFSLPRWPDRRRGGGDDGRRRSARRTAARQIERRLHRCRVSSVRTGFLARCAAVRSCDRPGARRGSPRRESNQPLRDDRPRPLLCLALGQRDCLAVAPRRAPARLVRSLREEAGGRVDARVLPVPATVVRRPGGVLLTTGPTSDQLGSMDAELRTWQRIEAHAGAGHGGRSGHDRQPLADLLELAVGPAATDQTRSRLWYRGVVFGR